MCAISVAPAHFLFSVSATVRWPAWLPPLSPMKKICLKPCVLSDSAVSVSSARKVSSRKLIVPGEVMWPVGGSMSPSGTCLMTGAHSALPILRAIASQLACST